MGVLPLRAARSFFSQASCSSPKCTQAVGLEVHYIDQADEVNALVIEAVIAAIVRCLAKAGEIFRAGAVGDVMLAGNGVQFASAHILQQAQRRIEL